MLPDKAIRGGGRITNRVLLQLIWLALDLAPPRITVPRVISHERLVRWDLHVGTMLVVLALHIDQDHRGYMLGC